MAKKAARVQPAELQDSLQEAPDVDESGSPAGGKSLSKAEAIRRAIADGYDSPASGPDYIRSTFGLNVSKAHFSASKSNFKKQDLGKKTTGVTVTMKRGRKPKDAPRPAGTAPAAAAPKASGNGEGALIAALESIKPLVASLGAEKVKRLVDLLG